VTDTPPPIDRATLDRISKIFFPYSHAESERAYAGGRVAKFAHYTSADVALKIIKEKRIWMRNTTCMADYKEVTHGHEMLRVCFEGGSRERFRAALNACREGVADKAINLFDKHWADTLFNTFVTCLSEHDENTEDRHGRLSMWRAFAPNTTRVALVFAVPRATKAVQHLSLTFAPVGYFSQAKMQEQLDLIIANIGREKEFLTALPPDQLRVLALLTLRASHVGVKHEGFHEEREWRAIYGPVFWQSAIMAPLMTIEPVWGVPQRVYRIPLDIAVNPELREIDFANIFYRLIIGPSPYGAAMEDAFIRELRNSGVEDANNRVFRSEIPIRSLM
jgi:hypothetical protein